MNDTNRMNEKLLSDRGLKDLHAAIDAALAVDDATPPGKPVLYGVRHFADWREWGDRFEAELRTRGKAFVPIAW